MGLFGSKEERECRKEAKKCKRERRKCERKTRKCEKEQCRSLRCPRPCRTTPYVYVDDDCCNEDCCDNFVEVDCFSPTPKFRLTSKQCQPAACAVAASGCPTSNFCCPMPCCPPACPMMPGCNPCMPLDPVSMFNQMVATFPPGTDFSSFIASMNTMNGADLSGLLAAGLTTPSPLLLPDAQVPLNGGLLNFAGQNLLPSAPLVNQDLQPSQFPNNNSNNSIEQQPQPPPDPNPEPGYALAASTNPNTNQEQVQLPPLPAEAHRPTYNNPPLLPPISRERLYPRRRYAYDDYDADYYSRRRPRQVGFYDDFALDTYAGDDRRRRYDDYEDYHSSYDRTWADRRDRRYYDYDYYDDY